MEFGFDNGPHLKDKDHTSKIMSRLLMALTPIIIFAVYKNGLLPYLEGYTNLYGMLKPLIIILLGVLTSITVEIIYFRFILNKKDNLIEEVKRSYALFPGLFVALTLPINTPLWLVVLGSLIATLIGKLLFGGLGHNIFNPALVGCLFVIASYGALIGARGGYLNPMEIDTIAGATPLTNLSNINYVGTWSNIVKPFGSLRDFLLGFIPGSLGETSKILILLGFIYLAVTKVIKWVVPVCYVSVVFVMTFIIGTMNNIDIFYPLFHILSGGLLFGAVFMATDPITSPTTRIGQIIFGLGLGLLTVIFRFLSPYPEGVLTSILTMNMLVVIIDKIGAKAKFKKGYLNISLIVLLICIITFSIYIGYNLKDDANKVDDRFNIIEIREENNKVIYEVTQKGFKGLIKANITIANDKIIDVDITSQSETYWMEMENQNYINRLINKQDDLENVDVVSGATISSNALKAMVENVLADYEVRK